MYMHFHAHVHVLACLAIWTHTSDPHTPSDTGTPRLRRQHGTIRASHAYTDRTRNGIGLTCTTASGGRLSGPSRLHTLRCTQRSTRTYSAHNGTLRRRLQRSQFPSPKAQCNAGQAGPTTIKRAPPVIKRGHRTAEKATQKRKISARASRISN